MSFGLIPGRTDLLFCNVDWHSVEQGQMAALCKEIDQYDGDRLLNTSADDLVDYFAEKYQIDVPRLHEDAITVDQREVQFEREDYGRHFTLTGTRIEIEIPFSGEAEVFRVQPTAFSLNPPRGEVRGQSLFLSLEGTQLDAESVRREITRTISEVKEALDRLRDSAAKLNQSLRPAARERIESRRQKLLCDRNLVARLGFPMKQREGAPRTYSAPEVRRKVSPRPPKATSKPFEPEPELSEADYQNILTIMERMVGVMECSPKDFAHMGEETLRSHFLVQLNAQYEGQATGETFNYEGKTDILIKSKGRNIFIAECKFWRGPNQHSKTIDQLLGYLSWRDTKAAIVVFNRNKSFTNVLQEIERVTLEHAHCKKLLARRGESGWTFRFSHRDDESREMTVTVLAFDVPNS